MQGINVRPGEESSPPDSIKLLNFNDQGLIPAVIQDVKSGQVLMMAWMNQSSLCLTCLSGFTWFYSRSRKALWKKGETSGHYQRIREIYYDCDGDTLLIKVDQADAACHTGEFSCFHHRVHISS